MGGRGRYWKGIVEISRKNMVNLLKYENRNMPVVEASILFVDFFPLP